MRASSNKGQRPAKSSRLARATAVVIEQMESRTMMSATITAWNFNTLPAATNYMPAPSSGTGTASSVGMTSMGNGAGPYPLTTVAGEGPDSSAIQAASGGSEDGSTGNEWKIVGTKGTGTNGWNYNAPIGSQGAQFMAPTTGYANIVLSFDWGVSGPTANGQLAVEYTVDGGSHWTVAPSVALGANTNTAGKGDTAVMTNSTDANIVPGPYFLDQNNTAGGAGDYQNGLTADFSSVAAANNNPNFGIRLVNAATGSADVLSAAGTGLPSQNSANWRFDVVQIMGSAETAPTITQNPTDQSAALGSSATFSAAATGTPTPTVQWQMSTDGGISFSPDTTDAGNTTPSLSVTATATNNDYEYEAIFTSNGLSATTTPATLTVTGVNSAPAITLQPVSQFVAAGSSVTFTAAANGSPAPTVQWQISTNGGLTFSPIPGATSTSYVIATTTEGISGDQYEVVFTNSSGPVTSNPATLTVLGTPIAQWNFTSGLAPTAQSTSQGTGNSPYPTFGPLSNSASTLGLDNDYTGVKAFPESDILPNRSIVNTNFNEYVWRIRSGNGAGPTGSPGTPEGWSQDAPQYDATSIGGTDSVGDTIAPQGVEFSINTVGYSNVTLHYDWNQGGISDMQPQYFNGSAWVNIGSPIEANGSDYYGITPTANPTGVLINLQGIAAANNNPNFQLRLVTAYNASLPLISDGNGFDATVHGQYATGAPGPVNAQQVLQFDTGVSGGTFTLTYNDPAHGPVTTTPIAYSSDPATLIANINSALTSVLGAGNFTVAQTNPTTVVNGFTTAVNPLRDALGNTATDMTVTFGGTLAATAVTTMTADSTQLTGGSLSVATWVNGSISGFKPYVDGSGAWQLGNISFNGDSVNAGNLAVVTEPVSTTATTSTQVTFNATAYSEAAPVTAQWYVNDGSGPAPMSGATNVVAGAGSTYVSTYSFITDANDLNQNGYKYYCIFTQAGSTATSTSATLTVVAPVAPVIYQQPQNTSVQAGNVALFTAMATGSPQPTVQWQINDGTGWANLTDSTTVSGSTAISAAGVATLSYTTAADLSQNGYQFRALFSNKVGNLLTNAVNLTVLAGENVLTDWDFNNLYPAVNSSKTTADPYDDSPVPVAAGIDGSLDVGGVASMVGLTLPAQFDSTGKLDPATPSVAAADIVTTPGALNAGFSETTWRIRGGATATSGGGTPNNGWSNDVAEYTQGAQFSVPTTGYDHIYVTMDWYSTTSGELDAQEQYTTDGTTWHNINNPIQAVSNDFYGATASGGPVPLVIDVTGVPDVANNPNFGVRLVNSYNVILSNQQTLVLGGGETSFNLSFNGQIIQTPIAYNGNLDVMAANIQSALSSLSSVGAGNVTVTAAPTAANPLAFTVAFVGALGNTIQPAMNVLYATNDNTNDTPDTNDQVIQLDQYANAALVGTPAGPAPYNGSKGNWRFDNIIFHGTAIVTASPLPAWISGTAATWNAASDTLEVTGPGVTINEDPNADTETLGGSPVTNPNIIVDAGQTLHIKPSSTPSSSGSPAYTVPTSGQLVHLGGISLGNGANAIVDSLGGVRTASNHVVLVVGTGAAAPTFSVASGKLDMTDNDLIIHNGNLAAVQADAAIGRNVAPGGVFDGPWNGGGLTSSAANAAFNANGSSEVTVLAVVQNSEQLLGQLPAWVVGSKSETLSGSDIIVKYTYNGDFALEGFVGDDSSTIFALNYDPNEGTGHDWAGGDANGDGTADDTDATIFSIFYGNGTGGTSGSQL